MSKLAKRILFGVTAFVVISLLVMTSITYAMSPLVRGSTNTEVWRKVWWRFELYGHKAKGGLPELSWSELFQMTRYRGGFGLEGILRQRKTADGSVRNEFNTREDYTAGAALFRKHCVVCHGADAGGGHGPALNRADLKHGGSDLAMYRVMRDGVPGTAMRPAHLSMKDRWQLVGYLRALQLRDSGEGGEHVEALHIHVRDDHILSAGTRADEWLTYSGSLDGHRYARVDQITPANASKLRLLWAHQFDSQEPVIEATPLVVGGTIFTTEPPSSVVALDAKTGNALWRYERHVPDDVPVCCLRVNRGLAVLGSTLYLATLDGYLVAIDANSGQVKWEIEVANAYDGYSLTVAPLIVGRQVVVGVAGGEFGIRGFLVAYDVETGKQRWKFMTVPGEGEAGHESWQNDAWKTGGGPTWVTGSYDPALDLLYWGVGNPSPDFSGDVRPGDNLFTDSVVALHASTGTLAWHFQFTPHDEHDWDSNQTPILADLTIGGVERKVICWANRNGFYYVLDRATGEFLTGVPFVEQNWTEGLDASGRPIPVRIRPGSSSERLTRPGVGGGTNWQNAAFDEARGLFLVHATEGASVFTKAELAERGDRGFYAASAGSQPEPMIPVVRALDPATGAKQWEYFSPPLSDISFALGGLLATKGGVVFGASGGTVFGLDSRSGREVWRVTLGGDTRAPVISFMLDGRQVIAASSGRTLFVFGL